jgi:hypothetical protein
MSSKTLLRASALLAGAVFSAESSRQEISVTRDAVTGTYVVQDSIVSSADAYGFFESNYNSSGWGYLDAHMRVSLHYKYLRYFGFNCIFLE